MGCLDAQQTSVSTGQCQPEILSKSSCLTFDFKPCSVATLLTSAGPHSPSTSTGSDLDLFRVPSVWNVVGQGICRFAGGRFQRSDVKQYTNGPLDDLKMERKLQASIEKAQERNRGCVERLEKTLQEIKAEGQKQAAPVPGHSGCCWRQLDALLRLVTQKQGHEGSSHLTCAPLKPIHVMPCSMAQ
jgi:hypothetical protein